VLVFDLTDDNGIQDQSASHVLGQPDFNSSDAGTTSSTLDSPAGLAYDPANNRLFVDDELNNRILVFDTTAISDGEGASAVLGQPDFVSSSTDTTSSTLSNPMSIAYDASSSRLFVMDSYNSRILIFNVPPLIPDGEGASAVLGQPDFVSSNTGVTSSTFNDPSALVYDPDSEMLWVGDTYNNRTLGFNVATSSPSINGEGASYVLGQPDFTSNGSGNSSSTLNSLSALGYDNITQQLIVADGFFGGVVGDLAAAQGNNRILGFNVATSSPSINGEGASYVLGQPDFASDGSGASDSTLNAPSGIDYIADPATRRLFVADTFNNRIVQYDLIRITDFGYPDGVQGTPYEAPVITTSTQSPITLSVVAGSLPPGLNISGMSIVGTPTAAGIYPFTLQADDQLGDAGVIPYQSSFSISISGSGNGGGVVPSGNSGSGVSTLSTVAYGGGGSAYDLLINNGATTTASSDVVLSLYGTAAYTMELSNTPDFIGSTWIPYATSMAWTLPAGAGEKSVYVRYRAASGSLVGGADASISLAGASASGSVMSPSQIKSLLALLESELQTIRAANSSVTPRFVFTHDLSFGMVGSEVKQLQLFLISKNTGPAAGKLAVHGATMNFATLTRAALVEFQTRVHIVPASGFFGRLTRAYVNSH
jgi:sugar lactone lactonase YvrE